MRTAFEYKHRVGFGETNLLGNTYFAHFVYWQGLCREEFLRRYIPDVLEMFKNGFALITTRVSCEFIGELSAFDEVTIRMRLGGIRQNRIAMTFEYWKTSARGEELVARGEQEIACMRREGDSLTPVPVPENFKDALGNYAD